MFDPRPAKQADKRGASEASERHLDGELPKAASNHGRGAKFIF